MELEISRQFAVEHRKRFPTHCVGNSGWRGADLRFPPTCGESGLNMTDRTTEVADVVTAVGIDVDGARVFPSTFRTFGDTLE